MPPAPVLAGNRRREGSQSPTLSDAEESRSHFGEDRALWVRWIGVHRKRSEDDMGVEFGIWRIDGGQVRLPPTPLPDESRLEVILERDIDVLALDLLVIGRQVPTDYGKFIDLLAINAEGDLAVIELKRDRTPREVVAQVLDYGSWVVDLGFEDVLAIYAKYNEKTSFEEAFSERFGTSPPDALNQHHTLVIVASELDASTERIVGYLFSQYGVPVNAVFFRYFVDGERGIPCPVVADRTT